MDLVQMPKKPVVTNSLGQRLKADGTVDKRSLFKKGKSGNPAGRPKGAKGVSAELRKAIEGQALENLSGAMPALIEQAIGLAMNGNENMIKFCIERFVPKAAIADKDPNKGIGGIVINVTSMEPIEVVPLEGEVIEEDDQTS